MSSSGQPRYRRRIRNGGYIESVDLARMRAQLAERERRARRRNTLIVVIMWVGLIGLAAWAASTQGIGS